MDCWAWLCMIWLCVAMCRVQEVIPARHIHPMDFFVSGKMRHVCCLNGSCKALVEAGAWDLQPLTLQAPERPPAWSLPSVLNDATVFASCHDDTPSRLGSGNGNVFGGARMFAMVVSSRQNGLCLPMAPWAPILFSISGEIAPTNSTPSPSLPWLTSEALKFCCQLLWLT